MKVGFIGLGQMGSGIATNLLNAGHELTVWNRSEIRARPLFEIGAKLALTPAAAAQGDVVFTMVSDDRAVETLVYGNQGILDAPALHISLSTISLELADRLACDHGLRSFLSAPVFGRPQAAATAKLFIVAAGAYDQLDRFQPLFDVIGQRTFRVGDRPSAANLVKLSGNFLIMSAIEAMAEAMTLAEKGGVARATLMDILTSTLFDAPVYRTYGEILVEDKFRPAGFSAALGLKDMNLVDAAATNGRVAMPLVGVMRDHLRSAIAQEGPDVDWTGIALPLRRAAGLP